jgi:hypothetical protein
VSLAPLALGIVLHLLASCVRVRGWFHALRAAAPKDAPRYRDVLVAQLGGAGLNGVLPAHGGDAVKLFLLRERASRLPLATLAGTLVPLALVEAALTAALFAWAASAGFLALTGPVSRLPDVAEVPVLAAAAVLGAVALLVLARRVPRLLVDARRGLAILARPRRLTRAAAWLAAARLLRVAGIACLMAAVSLPVGIVPALAVMAVLGSTPTVGWASTPVRAMALTAALPAVVGEPINAPKAAALLVAAQLVMAAVNLAISLGVLGVSLGSASPRRLLARARAAARGIALELRPAGEAPPH